MALRAASEPPTLRLTARCPAVELARSEYVQPYHLDRGLHLISHIGHHCIPALDLILLPKDGIADKLDRHRQTARTSAYQTLLSPECSTPLVVSPEVCFSYDSHQYPHSKPYRGHYEFEKRFYPEVGDLASKGEESECAQFIDQLDKVELWVRNLERRPRHFFWLQTSTDKFYPDFVAKLADSRILIVEYKGEHLWGNEDSTEKRNLGGLWALRSDGRCLFVMPKGKDWQAIRSTVAPPQPL